MSIVRLLAFETLGCGCVAGHYREAGSLRSLTYIEEKAAGCATVQHRRNHVVAPPARRPRVATREPAPIAWHP